MKTALGIIVAVLVVGGLVWFFRNSPLLAPLLGSRAPVATSTPITNEPQVSTYASSSMGISIAYPVGYSLNEQYAYDQFGPKKLIRGVSFTIPAEMATGTNLSSDTRISVEQLPRAMVCSGDIYVLPNVKASTLNEGGVTYSVASTSGAGAGNFYEELVYAIPGSKPCTAVRYLIHSTNIGNYPAGAVREFDRAALLAQFDTIRHSLSLGNSAPTATSTSTTTP